MMNRKGRKLAGFADGNKRMLKFARIGNISEMMRNRMPKISRLNVDDYGSNFTLRNYSFLTRNSYHQSR